MRMVAIWIIVIGFLVILLGFDSLILWIYGVDGEGLPRGCHRGRMHLQGGLVT